MHVAMFQDLACRLSSRQEIDNIKYQFVYFKTGRLHTIRDQIIRDQIENVDVCVGVSERLSLVFIRVLISHCKHSSYSSWGPHETT
jgi:hypothetical protein